MLWQQIKNGYAAKNLPTIKCAKKWNKLGIPGLAYEHIAIETSDPSSLSFLFDTSCKVPIVHVYEAKLHLKYNF